MEQNPQTDGILFPMYGGVLHINACRPGVKEQIEKQTLNSSGVRDISRNLGIAKGTVISELKKKRQRK